MTRGSAAPLVLVNPHAAGGRAAALHEPISRWLRTHASSVRCELIDGIEAARAAVLAQPPGTRVVLVGGDGSLHPLLPALVAQNCELALVPMGSGNDLARSLGVAHLGWQDALALGMSGSAQPMDLGEVGIEDGNRPEVERRVLFASSLAAGFDAAVGGRALCGPKALRGLPRYLWATLGELAALRRWHVRVRTDEGHVIHDGETLFASGLNSRTYGGGMPAVPHARIDDGQLDLLVAGRFGRIGTLAMLPRLLLGRHLSHPQVHTMNFTTVHVESISAQALPLAADGEMLGHARAWRLRVRPALLRVVRGEA